MNVDWYTVLLIIIFFVFPLIQQVLEAKRGRQQRPPPPDGFEDEWAAGDGEMIAAEHREPVRAEAPLPTRRTELPQAAQGPTSAPARRTELPSATPIPTAAPAKAKVARPPDWSEGWGEWPTVSQETVPAKVEPRVREVEQPRLEVPSTPEYVPLQMRELSVPELKKPAPKPRAKPPVSAAPRRGPQAPPDGAFPNLNRSNLRQAIILSEVLGPPKSLQ